MIKPPNIIVNMTVQKTYAKFGEITAEFMRVSETGFHCTINIRLMNTKTTTI